MKKAILVAVIGAMTLGVNAGDWGKAPIPAKGPIEECYDIGAEISVGYMTDYIFYGVRFARDSVWADVNYTFDNLAVPITVGAWYLNGINGDPRPQGAAYDELDLYISAALGTYAGFDVDLGYTHYINPELRSGGFPFGGPASGTGYGEANLGISRSLGFVDLAYGANYAFGGGNTTSGWYHQFGLERTFGITDTVSLVLGAGVGYSDGYFAGRLRARNSGWNHYYLTASLPIELNCRATLTPYIGFSGSPSTWIAGSEDFNPNPRQQRQGATPTTAQGDILHGGVSLSVSF